MDMAGGLTWLLGVFVSDPHDAIAELCRIGRWRMVTSSQALSVGQARSVVTAARGRPWGSRAQNATSEFGARTLGIAGRMSIRHAQARESTTESERPRDSAGTDTDSEVGYQQTACRRRRQRHREIPVKSLLR